MSHPAAAAGRTAVTITALVIGSILLLLSASGAIPRVFGNFSNYWNGELDLITPRVPFTDSWADIGKDDADAYAGLLFGSPDALLESRLLSASADGLAAAVAVVGSLLIVLIAIRILMNRSFSTLARRGLIVLGILLTLNATLGPQLKPLAADIAAQKLGYPIFDPAVDTVMTEVSPEKVLLTLWDPIWTMNRFDLTMLLLGIVVLLFSFLMTDGVRLQKGNEAKS